MNPAHGHRRWCFAALAFAIALATPVLCADSLGEPQPAPGAGADPRTVPSPAPKEPPPAEIETRAPNEPPEVCPPDSLPSTPPDDETPPSTAPEEAAAAEELQPASEPTVPAQNESAPPEDAEPAVIGDPGDDQTAAVELGKGKRAPNPCKQKVTFEEAWIDKLRRGVFYTVCGSAAWFDGFFGREHEFDPTQVYGLIAAGLLHEATGELEAPSKFEVNLPLPNLSSRVTAFLGRDDPDDFISDAALDLSAPEAFRSGGDERSWLAGFGYSPPGKRGGRMSYRLGVKVSTDPYVFAQARYRFNHYTAYNTAFRFHETVFYRTNEDEFGSTTYVGYDWIPGRNYLARVSAQGTITEDTDGVKWKTYATFYHDLELRSGSPRGLAYQLLANGETDEVEVGEYGFLAIYREQVLREWLFAEVTLGYSWVKEEVYLPREGGPTIGLVFEIRFGDYYGLR